MRILVIDDEEIIVNGLVVMINKMKDIGAVVKGINNVYKAIDEIILFQPHLILVDINMKGIDGLTLIKKIREKNISSEIIIISGYNYFSYARNAIQLKVFDYLLKPINKQELYENIKRIKKSMLQNVDAININDIKCNIEADINNCSEQLRKIISYIDKNLYKGVSLTILSDVTNLHPNYISVLFKNEVGINFTEYVNIIRTQKAISLLKLKDHVTMGEIADTLGYQSERQFFRTFKKMTGFTPKEFKMAKTRHLNN